MRKKLLYAVAIGLSMVSCKEIEVKPFDINDSAVYFGSGQLAVSLRSQEGVAEPVVEVPVKLLGPVADYDRPISLEFSLQDGDNAVEGDTFSLVEALVPAGELVGHITLKVKALEDGDPVQVTSVSILDNEHFSGSFKTSSQAKIMWTSGYIRPEGKVYFSWWYFFSTYYSVSLHKLLVEYLGESVELRCHTTPPKDSGFIRTDINWFYSASREFYNFVKKHDAENPDNPYMHSPDVRQYSSYTESASAGTVPETVPTILSTLIII